MKGKGGNGRREATYPLVHARAVLLAVRERVSNARHDINGRDALILREVPTRRHRLMSVHVELATARARRVPEHPEVLVRVLLGVEAEAHGGPAVLVRDVRVAVAEEVVDEDELGVARVRHAVVADEDDVDDVGQVARLDLVVQVAREDVDLLQYFLYARASFNTTSMCGNGNKPTLTSLDVGPAR